MLFFALQICKLSFVKSHIRYANNTDHTVTQLNVISALSGEVMGVINWFAVHGTSLPNTNTLICGDNKGMASLMFEKKINQGQLLGKVST